MKAEIRKWKDLAEMEDPSGLVVLHEGGLLTIRTISPDQATTAMSRARYYVSCWTPWKEFKTILVRGDYMVAVPENTEEGK